MLKAAIVYPMGAGGNFLTRLLTLSEKSIPMIKHEDLLVDQVNLEMTAAERFALYNHFTVEDWRTSEYSVIMQYKWGHRDFYEYEQSSRYLIDSWHPHVFLAENARGTLWAKAAWQHIIFINGDEQDCAFFNNQGRQKDYPPNTVEMYQCQHTLRTMFHANAIDLPFKTLINRQLFTLWLTQVDQQLELNLDHSLAMLLWDSWLTHSNTCWFDTVKFDRKNVYGQNWNPKITKQ